MTPLYMAAQENHIDVAKELLAHGADAHLAASVRIKLGLCLVEISLHPLKKLLNVRYSND